VNLPARVSLLTLACRDVERMARLFRALGWPETPESDEHHRTFQCRNGVVIALYGASNYEPAFGPPADGFRGFTIAVNLESFDETKAVYETLQGIEDGRTARRARGGLLGWGVQLARSGGQRLGRRPGRRARASTTAAA